MRVFNYRAPIQPPGAAFGLVLFHKMTSSDDGELRCQAGLEDVVSVEGIVLSNCPARFFLFFRHGKEILVSRILARSVVALAFVMEDHKRRRIFPLHEVPLQQRMLSFGVAYEVGALPAIISFPLSQQLAAIAVTHLCDETVG